MGEHWRDCSPNVWEDFRADVVKGLKGRQEYGAKKYSGGLFQGEPLDHAWEEALDLLFYLWKSKLQRMSLGGYADK